MEKNVKEAMRIFTSWRKNARKPKHKETERRKTRMCKYVKKCNKGKNCPFAPMNLKFIFQNVDTDIM